MLFTYALKILCKVLLPPHKTQTKIEAVAKVRATVCNYNRNLGGRALLLKNARGTARGAGQEGRGAAGCCCEKGWKEGTHNCRKVNKGDLVQVECCYNKPLW